jgi:hypothetical protein
MNSVKFNTGRTYTLEGQIIIARQIEDGRVLFVDLARGVDGVTLLKCQLTQKDIMSNYDAGLTQPVPFELKTIEYNLIGELS